MGRVELRGVAQCCGYGRFGGTAMLWIGGGVSGVALCCGLGSMLWVGLRGGVALCCG